MSAHVELKAFDTTLAGTAESLMGAVQDAEDEGDTFCSICVEFN